MRFIYSPRRGLQRFHRPKAKCGLCKRKLTGPYRTIGEHPRCYWCLKRMGNV